MTIDILMDMYEYMDIDDAKERIVPNQLYFLEKVIGS